jgi:hypothetical protein
MKQLFYGLMAVGLFLGMAANVKGQPTYRFKTIEAPGSSVPDTIFPSGINASGEIVGDYVDCANHYHHGFLLDRGIYTGFDVPDSLEASAHPRIDDQRCTSCRLGAWHASNAALESQDDSLMELGL